MHLAIIIIWIVGLLGAVPATITILKLASLIVYCLLDILRLCGYTRQAADGIRAHVSTIRGWPDLGDPARRIAAGAVRIAASSRSLHATFSDL